MDASQDDDFVFAVASGPGTESLAGKRACPCGVAQPTRRYELTSSLGGEITVTSAGE